MAYHSSDLVRVAKRERNPRRKYLVINRLQGKHIPVKPAEALAMFQALADQVPQSYAGPRTLVIGFAETATAIGAALAAALGAYYIQTTREEVPGAEYLYFTEEHSHAAQQRLVKNDLDRIMPDIDRVLFAEDEVTTGKTIRHLIGRLEAEYPGQANYAAASVLNGMDAKALEDWKARQIEVFYLVKTEQADYARALQRYAEQGVFSDSAGAAFEKNADGQADRALGRRRAKMRQTAVEAEADGWMDARRLVCPDTYEAACKHLWDQVRDQPGFPLAGRILVLGTEEFMYPALWAAEQMARGGADVRFHATTRSPIEVYEKEPYPLHVRYPLPSLYDKNRQTFVYDLGAYDSVWIFTDAHNAEREGMDALVQAVSLWNENICVVRWC